MVNTDTIEIDGLSIGYRAKGGDKVVASGLTASLGSRELTCLLGPNGSGKSTLLRTLSAFQPALGGVVRVMNSELDSYRSGELAKIVSVVLTDNSGIKNMTAWEVVAMGRSPYTGFWGRLAEKDKTVVEKCLGWVGIEELAQRKMQTLSDGERQKVMIAKAIAQETPIIILDEPTAYLDYPSKIAMMLLLHRLAKALNKTVLLSTHDLENALQVADRVWLLDKQMGLTTGVPEDLSLDGSVERYFARDDMSYDMETCSFSVQYTTAREVAVSGDKDSAEYRLFCKAMLRNGMQPVEPTGAHADDKVQLCVPGDGTYRLIEEGRETLKVDKIGHLIGVIVPAITQHQICDIRESAGMNQYE